MATSYKEYRKKKARKKGRARTFPKVENRKKIRCGFPCTGSTYVFEKVEKGCKRTCTGCGYSIIECGDRNPTPVPEYIKKGGAVYKKPVV